MIKTCTCCKAEKDLSEFHKDPQHSDGYRNQCKECRSKYDQQPHRKLIAKKSERKRRDTPLYRMNKYKRGAVGRGLEWGLTEKEFMGFWQAPCDYCGGDISTVGLDRIDSKKGYTVDNVSPCCFTCNRMKGTLNKQDFIKQCERIVNGFIR